MNKVILFALVLAIALTLTFGIQSASADTLYTISIGNAGGLGCCTGPYATSNVHLVDATHATVTFDSLTNGGLGVAFFWPWSAERYFLPFEVIEVSPIGIGFFSARGAGVLLSELVWVWMPCALVAAALLTARKAVRRSI